MDTMFDKNARNALIQRNRERSFNAKMVKILLDISRMLTRQGLPFRGSGDDTDGNFRQIALLIARHNPVLKKWMAETKNRPTMLHILVRPIKMNSDLLGNEIRKKVIADICNASFYSVMADTTPDSANKDQLSIIIRYVDHDDLI